MGGGRIYLLVVCCCLIPCFGVLIPPSDPNIQYVGRVDRSNSSAYTFDWSGTQIFATFENSTTVALVFTDYYMPWRELYFDVYIDGQYVSWMNISGYIGKVYPLAENLTLSPHSVNVKRRVEADAGLAVFVGILLDDGATLVPSPARPDRRIEFIGDSITCGWGAIGFNPCYGLYGNEDNLVTYAAVASEIVGADYVSISWSGQGLVRHYGCPNITCYNSSIPSLYNRTLGEFFEPFWDYSTWIPQAVAVNLGTNDYGSEPYPPIEIFVQGYIDFVEKQLVPNYGHNVTIFASCFWAGLACESVQAAAGNLTALGYNVVYVSYASLPPGNNGIGCSTHPNFLTHQKWGEYLAPIIQKVMGWW